MSGPRRFTVTPEQISGDRVAFDRAESRHMSAVLRLTPGDVIVAVDGRGHDYTVRLERLGEAAAGTILRVTPSTSESPLAISLVQGVPKGDKMDTVVRAATELGVRRVMPAITERTIARADPGRWRDRSRRWQRVAREASKQSGRAFIPEVEVPRPLDEWLDPDLTPAELRICLWEGQAPPLASLCDHLARAPATAVVLVGPEGGLSREEVDRARSRGWSLASLGPRILRTETAAPSVIAVLQFRFGDFGGGRVP